ncbi:MAG TPA: hypothetical protein PLP17_08885 [Oligoflexia bacterium]|nr:hypothetical protein [Oligoflexia bacterium]
MVLMEFILKFRLRSFEAAIYIVFFAAFNVQDAAGDSFVNGFFPTNLAASTFESVDVNGFFAGNLVRAGFSANTHGTKNITSGQAGVRDLIKSENPADEWRASEESTWEENALKPKLSGQSGDVRQIRYDRRIPHRAPDWRAPPFQTLR